MEGNNIMKKKLTILIPTYNEEANILMGYERCVNVMENELPHLDFEILYIDNHSTDKTRELIRGLCEKDPRVKAIFNAKNFGYIRSPFYGLLQTTGDAVMMIHADMQNPPEKIPEFVSKWENGAKVVIGIKPKSKENPVLYAIRGIYYKMMRLMSQIEQVEQFSDYELLDKDFVEVLRQIDDPTPYLRGLVMEYGYNLEKVYYTQNKREYGKSHASFAMLYDYAMLGITSYSKTLLRAATFVGGGPLYCAQDLRFILLSVNSCFGTAFRLA